MLSTAPQARLGGCGWAAALRSWIDCTHKLPRICSLKRSIGDRFTCETQLG
jgi:hypothetical protein